MKKASTDFLQTIQPAFEPLSTGHIPLDADVTPMDNSGSHKEGVSRTYKGCDGDAPMPAYLGQEGYCLYSAPDNYTNELALALNYQKNSPLQHYPNSYLGVCRV